MITNDIRLVLPSGPDYRAALCDGAYKVVMRQGLSAEAAKAVGDLVELAAIAIDTTDPASIELNIVPAGKNLGIILRGRNPATKANASRFEEFAGRAAGVAVSHRADPAAAGVSFEIALP